MAITDEYFYRLKKYSLEMAINESLFFILIYSLRNRNLNHSILKELTFD
jgi:hypothetical protein